MARGWFICGGSSKDTVPTPPLRESEDDDDDDLADGKSRVVFTSVGSC